MAETATTSHPWGDAETPFHELGGEEPIRALVERFYDIVDVDAPILRAMLPADDAVSRKKLFEYLVEWTGGDDRYTSQRGHPMMRKRHMPFAIGEDEVRSWIACMERSFDDNEIAEPVRSFLLDRLTELAHRMRNR